MRTRQVIKDEIERKGSSVFQQIEIWLDIRDLLQELVENIKDNKK